jgi:hypothetical protein
LLTGIIEGNNFYDVESAEEIFVTSDAKFGVQIFGNDTTGSKDANKTILVLPARSIDLRSEKPMR